MKIEMTLVHSTKQGLVHDLQGVVINCKARCVNKFSFRETNPSLSCTKICAKGHSWKCYCEDKVRNKLLRYMGLTWEYNSTSCFSLKNYFESWGRVIPLCDTVHCHWLLCFLCCLVRTCVPLLRVRLPLGTASRSYPVFEGIVISIVLLYYWATIKFVSLVTDRSPLGRCLCRAYNPLGSDSI